MLVPGQDKLGGLRQKGIRRKKWDDGGECTDGVDGVTSRQMVGASASVIFPCIIKSRWWAVMEEVNDAILVQEVCLRNSKYCDRVYHYQHTDLWSVKGAVNLIWPSSWLWLYAGLIGSNNRRWLKAP